jgi:hypothetical protein
MEGHEVRRTIAAVGLLGLGLLGTTIPAGAAPGNGQGGPDSTICHETGSDKNPVIEVPVNEDAGDNGNGGENGNAGGNGGENGNAGDNGNGGENGNAGGNGRGEECYEEPPYEEPPAEEPPAEEPPAEEPAAEVPVVNPVVKPVVKAPVVQPAAKPAAKPAAQPAAAVSVPVAAPAAPNVGYNLETAVGRTDAETPVWLGAATGLFVGFSVLVLWRRREGANEAEG